MQSLRVNDETHQLYITDGHPSDRKSPYDVDLWLRIEPSNSCMNISKRSYGENGVMVPSAGESHYLDPTLLEAAIN